MFRKFFKIFLKVQKKLAGKSDLPVVLTFQQQYGFLFSVFNPLLARHEYFNYKER